MQSGSLSFDFQKQSSVEKAKKPKQQTCGKWLDQRERALSLHKPLQNFSSALDHITSALSRTQSFGIQPVLKNGLLGNVAISKPQIFVDIAQVMGCGCSPSQPLCLRAPDRITKHFRSKQCIGPLQACDIVVKREKRFIVLSNDKGRLTIRTMYKAPQQNTWWPPCMERKGSRLMIDSC